jgi:hypothetical protein
MKREPGAHPLAALRKVVTHRRDTHGIHGRTRNDGRFSRRQHQLLHLVVGYVRNQLHPGSKIQRYIMAAAGSELRPPT